MQTRLALINAGLSLLGEQPLEFESDEAAAAFSANASINPEDDVQRTMGAIYPMVRSTLLNAHPWSWLTVRHRPIEAPWRLGEDVPQSDWAPFVHRYQLNNPFVASIRAVYLEGMRQVPATEGWTVRGGYLWSMRPIVALEDQRQTDESVWPELFDTAVILSLAAHGALPIMQDIETGRQYERKAEMALKNAQRVDAQSHPVKTIPRFSWEEARRSGAARVPLGWS